MRPVFLDWRLIGLVSAAAAQSTHAEVRRANRSTSRRWRALFHSIQPTPTPRPRPHADERDADASKTGRSSLAEPTRAEASARRKSEPPDERQLEYANALFTRKLYDLAVPEYRKISRTISRRVRAARPISSLGECYRNLESAAAARTNFQSVLDDYGESDFAGSGRLRSGRDGFSRIRITLRRCRFSIARRRNPRSRRWRFRRAISKRDVSRLSIKRMKHAISTQQVDRSQRTRIHTAKIRAGGGAILALGAGTKDRRFEAIRGACERNAETAAESRSDRARRLACGRLAADRRKARSTRRWAKRRRAC